MSRGARRFLAGPIRALCARSPWRRMICWHAPRSRTAAAITLDDGPHETFTPMALDALESTGAMATFFVLGREAERYPALIERMARSGHEIGVHTFDHSPGNIEKQVRSCEAILAAHGVQPSLFRPPRGELRPGDILWLARHGYTSVLWSFDAHDCMRREGKWQGPPPDYRRLRGGDIVLMHDENPVCVEDLPRLVESLRAKNLRPVTVSELLGLEVPRVGANRAMRCC